MCECVCVCHTLTQRSVADCSQQGAYFYDTLDVVAAKVVVVLLHVININNLIFIIAITAIFTTLFICEPTQQYHSCCVLWIRVACWERILDHHESGFRVLCGA